MLMGERDRLFSIGSFNNYVETGPFKERSQAPANGSVVVCQHHSQRHQRIKHFPLLRS